LERDWERKRRDDVDSEVLEDAEVRARELDDFEKVQAGLGTGRIMEKRVQEKLEERVQEGGTKRKFELDEEELMRIAKEERRKVRKEMDDEKKASAKHLPSFWAPSQTPVGTKVSIPEKPPKLNPLCPSSSESSPHNLTLKTLTSIRFTEEKSGGKTLRSCPACRKALTNISKGVLAIPCGHVLCKSCVDQFMKPVMTPDPHNPGMEHGVLRCFVCETNLMDEDENDETKVIENGNGKRSKNKKDKNKEAVNRGLVELRSEGTGFAGGGKNTVEKSGVAFQC
jgi:nitric oxide synthase-interacting protein